MYCEECGTSVKPTAKFCPTCGHSLQASELAPEQSRKLAEPARSPDPDATASASSDKVANIPAAKPVRKPESRIRRNPATTETVSSVETGTSIMRSRYAAIIGDKNLIYYLEKFEQFDRQGPGLKASWNWVAFFLCFPWTLYRKMYGWFFAFLGVEILIRPLGKAGSFSSSEIVGIIVTFVYLIIFAIFANSLYHERIKKKIAVARLTIKDESKLLGYLKKRGGVNTWVLWIVGLIFISSIAIAILIPWLSTRPSKVAMTEQRQTGSAEITPGDNVESIDWEGGVITPPQHTGNSNPAEPTDKLAQYELAGKYESGSDGFVKDETEAAKWYRKSADQGYAAAQSSLGVMYFVGRGVPQDDREAAAWSHKAADQGNAIAQNNLGSMFGSGRGVSQDNKEAVVWYRKAADQGHVGAQCNLGASYANGSGVMSAPVAAYALFNLCAVNNYSESDAIAKFAAAKRSDLTKKMSAKQVETGQRLSQEMSRPGNLLKALDAHLRR
jgi:hypothetical protein